MQKEIKVRVGQNLNEQARCSFILVDFLVSDGALPELCLSPGDLSQNLLMWPGSHHSSRSMG